jgi:hypothetical protein
MSFTAYKSIIHSLQYIQLIIYILQYSPNYLFTTIFTYLFIYYNIHLISYLLHRHKNFQQSTIKSHKFYK